MSIPTNISEKSIWFNKLLDPTDNCKNLRAFCLNIFDCKLEKNQYWALRDMLDPKVRLIYLSNARQGGKTFTIATFQAITSLFPEFVIPGYHGKGNAYVFAPKKEQAEISFERFSNLVHFNKYNINSDSIIIDKFDKISFRNGFEARAITASRNAEIEGLTVFCIILDESQAISPYKVRECLTGETIVPLPNGTYSTLKNIVKEKLDIITPIGPEKPIKYIEYPEDTIYEITLYNGKILRCNENHNHLVYSKNWRDAKIGEVRILDTLKLKPGLRLAVPDSLPYFGNEGDYEEGLILGSFLGDGSFRSDKPEMCGLWPLLRLIEKPIKEKFGVYLKIKKETDKLVEVTFTGNNGGGVKNSNKLTKYFRDLGLWGLIGHDKFIPNRAWSKEFLRGLMVGLIETDGCVHQSNKRRGFISFTNTSKVLVEQIQNYLLKFGIHSNLSEGVNNGNYGKTKSRIWTVTIKGVEDIVRFYQSFQLIIKQPQLEKLYNQRKTHAGRNKGQHYPSNMRFLRIISIKKLDEKEPVYCITLKKPHLWIANNIITLNSILPMGGGIECGAKIIQCGVPGILGSHFHKAYKNKYDPQTNPLGYVHHVYPWQDCPRLDKEYIMRLKNEDPDSFERNYELKWERSNYGYFTTYEEYETCEEDYDVHEMYKKAIDNNWPMYWGIDFAKLRDSTVLITVAQNPETGHYYLVGDIIEFQGTEYIDQIGYIKNIYVPGHIKHTCADKSGVGEMPIEVLNDGGILTTGINFSLQSKDKIYKHLRYQIQNKLIHWPKKLPNKEYRKFKQQFLELEIEHKTTGLISVHHNLDDNLARDDYADALCLAIWSAAEYVEPNISFI